MGAWGNGSGFFGEIERVSFFEANENVGGAGVERIKNGGYDVGAGSSSGSGIVQLLLGEADYPDMRVLF